MREVQRRNVGFLAANVPTPELQRIARGLARKHATRQVGCEAEDLEQVALVALFAACENYDSNMGPPLEVYATLKMRNAIFDELRRLAPVTRSGHVREPRYDRVEEFDFSRLAADENQEADELDPAARKLLRPREERILLALGEGLTCKQVGELEGVSESRISQIRNKVRRRLEGAQAAAEIPPDLASLVGTPPKSWPSWNDAWKSGELSSRECLVLDAAAEGLTAQETADRFTLTVETIKTHRRNIIQKLQARSMINAVTIGFRRGIIT